MLVIYCMLLSLKEIILKFKRRHLKIIKVIANYYFHRHDECKKSNSSQAFKSNKKGLAALWQLSLSMRSHSILKVTLVHFASVTETNKKIKKKDQYHASILTFFKLLNRSTSILRLQFFHDMEAKPAKHSTYIKTCACDKLCQSKK